MNYKCFILFLILSTINDIFCMMPKTVVSNMRTFLANLNTNLNIIPPPRKTTAPAFIITVTRLSSRKTTKIRQEELDNILNCLSNLCTGEDFINTHAGQLPSSITGVLPLEKNLKPFIRKIHSDNLIKNYAKIIIFNEMFFSQEEPLNFLEKESIELALNDLSKKDRFLLLCPNFLFLEKVKPTLREEMKEVIQKTIDSIKNESMQIDDSCILRFLQKIANARSSTDASFNITPLINKSLCIHNGVTLMEYMKSTYFQESDNDLIDTSKNCWYFFGNGEDRLVRNNKLSQFLLRNISFEICFDLANGIRKKQKKDSKLHILQSNWIDSTDYQNQNNLVENKLIIHVDPTVTLDNVRRNELKKFGNTLSKKTFDSKTEHLTEKISEFKINMSSSDTVIVVVYKIDMNFKR